MGLTNSQASFGNVVLMMGGWRWTTGDGVSVRESWCLHVGDGILIVEC